ncbi:FAD binding domain-containing protein [Paenibacillus montanisoli]|uniref:Xanthine dehydrogenase family protein subunit M n=1 Tax=Paenibacillus montanisoli TaxID=2081970 RepID=A0A328U6V1_9BACL|nr:FAD binding domain-containing protein [Paenibacillus montanisoli]RAP75726.1 xanthine dehydrogenase family protein subunit M [Paenibacillus montanisoli]
MVTKAIASYRMKSLDETLSQLSKEDCQLIAGGTDLMVQRKSPRGAPGRFDKPVVFIDHLKELKQIYRVNQDIHIGACCTYSEMMEHHLIPNILKKAMKEIAAPAIRNRGTIGGNICNASPAGDTLPLLYIFNAKIRLRSAKGERAAEIRDFIQGPRKVDRLKDELVTEIILPEVPEVQPYFVFEKVANRRADAITKISFAGSMRWDEGRIQDARLAFGAVGPTIVRAADIEQKLVGQAFPLNDKVIDGIVAEFESLLKPIDDHRSTGVYRKTVALNLLRHFLEVRA